ncbi:MAG: FAD-dependent oxidoreductase [Mycoplasmoidaceae bacterium]
MKIVILGVNHAGTSAIRTLLELDKQKSHELIAYDRNELISFLGCGIALSVSGVVKEPRDLFYCNQDKLRNMGATLKTGYEILGVDPEKKEIIVQNIQTKRKEIECYDKLIYALGSSPIPSFAENSDLKNILVCKTFADAVKLKQDASSLSIKSVAIIGAGYIGIELAEAFLKKGKEVHIVELQDRILANNTDADVASILQMEIERYGIHLHLGEKVIKYEGKNGKVKKLITDKGEIDVDLVIESIGIKPNTHNLTNVDKIANGAIKINNKAQSSNEDIYVVGDSAAIFFPPVNTYQNIALATNAVKTGIVAAAHIMGIDAISIDSVTGTNAICVFNKKISTTGITYETALKLGISAGELLYEDSDLPEWMETAEKVAIKIVYNTSTMKLLGAQIVSFDKNNHSEWILALSLAIQNDLNLYQIATSDVYFLPHLNKPFNFVLSAILKILGFSYFEN